MSHSYSSISKFETCPRSYYHQYILKDVKFESNEAAKYGSEMHDFMDMVIKGTNDFTPRYEFLRPIVTKIKAMDARVVTEYELSFKQDKSITGWWDKSAFIKGKSDCTIFHPSEPRLMIKDWKFAKVKPESYALEMDMFVMLHLWKHPEIERIDTGLVWLKEPAPETKSTYLKSDLPRIEDDIMGKIARIENAIQSDQFPMRQTGLCYGWCGAKNCPSWKPKKVK